MNYLSSSYIGTHKELNIIPIGDLHIGSPHFDKQVLDKQLEWIDKHRKRTHSIR